MATRKVFISYTHDNDAHRERVRGLADSLRRDGVECVIDQHREYEHEGDWTAWMQKLLEASDFVLIVCTQAYRGRFEMTEARGVGRGARWEGMLIRQLLYAAGSENHKFIPVFFDRGGEAYIPLPLAGAGYHCLTSQTAYVRLLAVLTGQNVRPPHIVGDVVELTPERPRPLFPPPGELCAGAATVTNPIYASVSPQPLRAVHVFLPDPDGDQEDPFYQDGAVQREGFRQGMYDAGSLACPERVTFHPVANSTNARALFEEMQKCYDATCGAYFVMTMSTMIDEISSAFKSWHDHCVAAGDPPPVLIATVASAPGLAAADHGQLRWYIRSQEECAKLAEHLRSEGVTDAAVFFMTMHPRKSDSRYGNAARDIFDQEFTKRGGKVAVFHQITDDTAWEAVNSWCKNKMPQLRKDNPAARCGAFVVAYGDAMATTINALAQNQFACPIACSSTLTVRHWQPVATNIDEHIVTVMPQMKGTSWTLPFEDDRDVVFFFTRETIRRVLQITANLNDTREFVRRWVTGECEASSIGRRALRQRVEKDGDIVVELEVVTSKYWRWTGQ